MIEIKRQQAKSMLPVGKVVARTIGDISVVLADIVRLEEKYLLLRCDDAPEMKARVAHVAVLSSSGQEIVREFSHDGGGLRPIKAELASAAFLGHRGMSSDGYPVFDTSWLDDAGPLAERVGKLFCKMVDCPVEVNITGEAPR